MGFFEDRIKQKTELENEMFTESVLKLSGVVTGKTDWSNTGSERLQVISAIEKIGRYLNVTIPYSSSPDLSIEWYLDQYLRPQGIMWRDVALKDSWYKNATGAMLGFTLDDKPVALIPYGTGSYQYTDPATGHSVKINKETASLFKEKAILFYRTLPLRKIEKRDILDFIKRSVSPREIMTLVLASLLTMVLGMVTPAMTKMLLSSVVPARDMSMLIKILILLIIVTGATFIITIIKQLVLARISTKVTVPLQAAFMMRILTAPSGEMKQYSAGDLGSRIGNLYSCLKLLVNMFFSMILTAACSLICFIQMFRYAPGPAWIALAVTAVLIIVYVRVIIKQAETSANRQSFQAEESGLTYSLIEGMQKITLAGAEKRAFSIWARVYRKAVETLYDPPLLLKIFNVLAPVIMLAGTILMYITAFYSYTSPEDFMAFSASYGLLTASFVQVSTSIINFSDAFPVFRILKPVMDLTPETDGEKEVVKQLKGNISLRNITFGYTDDMPPVLNDLNMDIHAGEYVAIVGTTGCGKSTIVRLMLGFETPDHGEILYDGKSLKNLDLTSLRRKIGIVLQNGEIFQGTIFSNIAISGDGISEEDAWEAAKIAGIDEDIRRMPMKMNTPLPDGGRGVSGGQKQRLLIARAIASSPTVLIFDEATSALDNLTQEAVSDSLGGMACTRIVIAHRLSTIQGCDRIFCLDKGHIAEEGTYEELIQKDGLFAELIKRQQI